MKLLSPTTFSCFAFLVAATAAAPAFAKKKPVRIRPTSEKMMNLGAGVDIAAHKSVGSATCVQFKRANEKGTRKSSYNYTFTEHASDLRKAMDVDVAVSGGYDGALVSVQAKNRTQWMKGRSVSTLKRILLAQAVVPGPTYVARAGKGRLYPTLKKDALKILEKSGWTAFKRHCGTGYVSRVFHQHRYIGTAEFDLSNEEVMKSLRNSTEVKGNYATIKARVDVNVGTQFWKNTRNMQLKIRVNSDGAHTSGAPSTLNQLKKNVDGWMKRASKGAREAAAYEVEVTPYELLPAVQKHKYKPVRQTNLQALNYVADATWEMQSLIDSINAVRGNKRMFASTGWDADLRKARDLAVRTQKAGSAAFAACHRLRTKKGEVSPACRDLGRAWKKQGIVGGFMKLAALLPPIRSQCSVKVTGKWSSNTHPKTSVGGPELTVWLDQPLQMKSDGKKRKWDNTFKGSAKNRLRIELALEHASDKEFTLREKVWLTEGDVGRWRKTEATRQKLLRVQAAGGCTFNDTARTIARWGLLQGRRPARFEHNFRGDGHDQVWRNSSKRPAWLERVTLNFRHGVKKFQPEYRTEPRLALLSPEDRYASQALASFRGAMKRFSSRVKAAASAAKKVTQKRPSVRRKTTTKASGRKRATAKARRARAN